MPIPGLPTFTAGTLTAAQLNSIVTAIEEKFAAGVSTGDMTWPLTAGGDINMGQFSILNVGKFWNAYDASARTAGTTLQDTIDLLAADGGGVVIIPGNHTEFIPAAGISVPTNVSLIGDGRSSMLQMDGSASAAMVTFGSGADDAGLRGLRLQGNQSVNHLYVDVNAADNIYIEDCWFDNHGTSAFIQARAGAINLRIDNCEFLGNGATNAQNMIELTGSIGCQISDCNFTDWTTRFIYMAPAAGTPVSGTIISGCVAKRDESEGTQVADNSLEYNNATNSVASVGLIITETHIQGDGKVGGIKITGDGLSGVIITDNELHTTLEQPALLVHDNTEKIVIADNTINSRGGDGIVIGLDHGTETTGQTATLVREIAITGNSVYARSSTDGDGCALLMAPYTTSVGFRGSVSGNKFTTERAHVIQIWNVSTTRPLYLNIGGNSAFPGSDDYKGFASFQGMGGTNNGDIGTAAINHWFTMVGNSIPNSAVGADFTHSAAQKCIVQDNNR